jgi:hypothetical protein
MKKKISLYVLITFILSACKCEGIFITFSKLENLSTVNLSITTYKNGVIDSKVILVEKSKVAEIGQSSGRTKAIVFSTYIGIADSLIVEFNNNKKTTHYGYNKIGNNVNAILNTSNRNLFNSANYVQKTIKDDKCHLETEFIYTFTEQDYLNAK